MNSALIGHTGFVGGNLLRQSTFAATFSSASIAKMQGAHFDTIWCAGIRAVKWWANLHPKEDWQDIESLLNVLATVTCKHFVLISTVDVFQNSCGKTELCIPEEEGLHAYGRHRLHVEQMVKERFASHTIVRLPGLFGAGLKKNVIYDLLHDHQVDKFHSEASFQFYDLSTVHADCLTAVNAGLELVHFAVEPCTVGQVAEIVLGRPFVQHPEGVEPVNYDLQTVYAELYGAKSPYMQHRDKVMRRLAAFVQCERGMQV